MSVMRVVKTTFLMAVLAFLVVIGIYNRGKVNIQLPPLLGEEVRQPAAYMYFGFFAIGVLTGTVWVLGKSGGEKQKKA